MVLEHKEIMWPDVPLTEYQRANRESEILRYEENPDDFYRAWEYLNNHLIFWHCRFPENPEFVYDNWGFGSTAISTSLRAVPDVTPAIDVDVALVDSEGRVNDDETKNLHTEVWLEAGKITLLPREEAGFISNWHYHDPDLDCGAPTYEEAVIKLARKVWDKYGNDRRIADKED